MVILYSTNCPKCNILKEKLKEKNLNFREFNDTNLIIEKGILSVPVLEIDGEKFDFLRAIEWINNYKEEV